jgi:hypothetical protein
MPLRFSYIPFRFSCLLFLGALLFCFTTSLAQGGSVKVTGTVLDQETNQPLEYATLVLQRTEDPGKVTGGITDINGKFDVETTPGTYNVRVEYISYKT